MKTGNHKSNSEFGFLEVKVKLKNPLMENALKPCLFRKIPFPPLYLKSHILIRRASLELNYAIIGTLSGFEVVLRGLLLVEQFRVKDVEFIALDCFGRRVVIAVVLRVVFVPLNGDPPAADVLWFFIAEAALGFAGHPIVKLLLVLLQSFVFFELDDLLGDEVDCHG